MRILFLCSCLEEGRDGVGDYVRLLAAACARQGQSCAIVALHDSFVAGSTGAKATAKGDVASLRLPVSLSWTERIERVAEFREKFKPDWISFQLVPYAFQKKGILTGLVPVFDALTGGTPLHLMFHELWLGAGRPSPLRYHVVGRLQLHAIRRLLGHLRPELVTASNPVYAAMLRGLNSDAHVLPLFGNVPLLDTKQVPPIEELLPAAGIRPENREEWRIGVFFGALPREWKAEPFLSLLQRAGERAGKRICLVMVGRSDPLIWEQLQRKYEAKIVFINLGEQATTMISALLQSVDFGVAGSPWQLIGKSGTVAAMLDHGLPVIVTRDDFQPFTQAAEMPSTDVLVHRCDDALEDKLTTGLPKRTPRARVDEVAAQLGGELADHLPAR